MNGDGNLPRLVLVGGGHSHVQVLRRFGMDRPKAALTLVVDQPLAVYSGMVPGLVAGQYARSELEIDVVPLARRAGARVILGRATGLAPHERRLQIEGRPDLAYDLISWNVGSTVAGGDLPGIRELAVPTRPIGLFVSRVEEMLARWQLEKPAASPRVVVVGAGAGGVELAFTLRQRLRELEPVVTLVHDGAHLLPGFSYDLRRRVGDAAARRGIRVLLGHRALGAFRSAAGDGHEVRFERGQPQPFELLVWVTGATALPMFRKSGLDLDRLGFVLVRPTLQSLKFDDVFAAGDCASLAEAPGTPKAGVFAVREGPILEQNLRAALTGRQLVPYRPQRQFLALLNLGDGTAIGGKWGIAFEGPRVMDLKHHIDRKFMRAFQVLDPEGAPTRMFPPMPAMTMSCGGCAAKVGQQVLERALGRLAPPFEDPAIVLGLRQPDDVAAWRTGGGDLVVATVDAFKAFIEDPWLVGRVAAINATSDVFAKGATPRYALALVAMPEGLDDQRQEELLFQALAGMRSALDPLGVPLVGGHSTVAAELLLGLSIFGDVGPDDRLLPKGGVAFGQRLILTKALGTGVIFHAHMIGLARGPWLEAALESVLRPNREAARVARAAGATAMTDVTGFGLLGHLGEMMRNSGLAARLDLDALPALPGAESLLGRGLRSTFHDQNSRLLKGVSIDEAAWRHPRFELLVDPQTSGGLLLALPADQTGHALEALHQAGDGAAAVVGEVIEPPSGGVPLSVRVSCLS